MGKAKVKYQGAELNLWDFAGKTLEDHEVDCGGLIVANFTESSKKNKLKPLIESLSDCEKFLQQIYDDSLDKRAEV